MPRKDKDQELRDAQERARVEKQQQQGRIALEQANANDAAKTDEQKAKEEAEARAQQEKKQQEESDRAAAEQKAADEELARLAAEAAAKNQGKLLIGDESELEEELPLLSPNARLLKAGTVIHLNGEPCVLPFDAAIEMQHGASEQHFASVLARDPGNFTLNSGRLRLVYSQMNGTPLPLNEQRLKPEEMTADERAIFGLKE